MSGNQVYVVKDNSTGLFLTSYLTNSNGNSYSWGNEQNACEFATQNQEFLEGMGEPGRYVFIGKNPKPR